MKHHATIVQKDLMLGISKIERIKTNGVTAILEDIYMEILPSPAAILRKTNLVTTLITGIKAQTIAPLKIMLPTICIKVIQGLSPDAAIEFWYDKATKELEIRHNTLNLQFITDDADAYPADPTVEDDVRSLVIESPADFFGMLDIAKKFTSDNDLRPAMTGVLISDAYIVGTDAHRLVEINSGFAGVAPFQVIVPKDFITAAQSIEGKAPATFSFGKNGYAMYNNKSTKIFTKIIDEKYPQYKAAMPVDFQHAVEIDTPMLREQVRMCTPVANKATSQIVIDFQADDQNGYSIGAMDGDYGRKVIVKGSYLPGAEGSPEYQLAVNGRFLGEVLALIEEPTVTLRLNGATKAFMIYEGDNYKFLVMPLMIGK